MEINALQLDALYRAGLLPVKPDAEKNTKATLSFDGMLHEARSRMRCSSVKAGGYEPAPRPCPAKEMGKRGCACDKDKWRCAKRCQHDSDRAVPQCDYLQAKYKHDYMGARGVLGRDARSG